MKNEIATINKTEIVQAFLTSPTKYCRTISEGITSIKEALAAPEIQLSEWKAIDYNVTQSIIISFIKGMLIYFGRRNEDMDNTQVKCIVDDILSKYFYFRIEDVCLCFKMARTSTKQYGKFYGVIDGGTIMQWFATYDRARDEVIHTMSGIEPVVFTGEEITREEYEDIMLAKAMGGDPDAYKAYNAISEAKKRFFDMRFEVGNYKYNRKHKFDKK